MWNDVPSNVSMPSMIARRGLASVPLAQITNVAVMRSPRSVVTTQCRAASSQTVDVTVVWNTASS